MAFVLGGCSRYAPGYSGWTAEQIERIKEDARARYVIIPKQDNTVLGVNYINFDKTTYTLLSKTQIVRAKCDGPIYQKLRSIGSVSLEISVCLNSASEVNRIVFKFLGVDNAETEEVFSVAFKELKDNYGRIIFSGLDNSFVTKDQYRSIYFEESPSQADLLRFGSILVSDYITNIEVLNTNSVSRSDGYDRLVLDIKLRDYEALQKYNDQLRADKIKRQINFNE